MEEDEIYNFSNGATAITHNEIMKGVDLARLQTFATVANTGLDMRLTNNQINMFLSTQPLNATNQAMFSMCNFIDIIDSALNNLMQGLVFVQLNHHTTVKFFSFLKSGFSLNEAMNNSMNEMMDRRAKLLKKAKNGIYGRGFEGQDEAASLSSIDNMSIASRYLHDIKMKEVKELLNESFIRYIFRLISQKQTTELHKQLFLKYFKYSIWFKFYYYIREIFTLINPCDRPRLFRTLKLDCFDQLKLVGYSLLLNDIDIIDHVILQILKEASEEPNQVRITDNVFREKFKNAMAMEFVDSDFADFVIATCDASFANSKRPRMKYVQNMYASNI